jgi:biotin carboxylase
MKDVVLAIDVVEPGLVEAVKTHSKELGRPLKGIALVHKDFVKYGPYAKRPKDDTGVFEEIVVDFDNQEELQRALKPYAHRIFAVTTRYEDAMHHFSKAVPFLPYAHTPTESGLIWATEKPLMRERLRIYDESLVPKYVHLREEDLPRLHKLTRDFTFPVIIKPGSLWSQLLITECKTPDELEKSLRHVFQVIQKSYDRKLRDTKPGILIEEMIQGDMYTTDAYVRYNGEIFCLPLIKVITAHSMGVPGFYDYRDIAPVEDLSEEETKAGFVAAETAIRAINLCSATAHIEMFKTKQGWKIIELGARIGGDREVIYREVYGVDHHYNDIAVRAGMTPKMPNEAIGNVVNDLIFADEEGIIESIDGIEEVKKLPSTVMVDIQGKPGDEALFTNNGGEYIVDVILSNTDKKRLDKDAVKVRDLIKIKVRKR